ncbi:hypothetical protein OF83DRAFT_609273 [Amylostereum chailletii]|nr:hypothetical protein OF83DRAFT_609273 [Amylostereum chailletii]
MRFVDTHSQSDPFTTPLPEFKRLGIAGRHVLPRRQPPHPDRPTDFSRCDVPGEFKYNEASDAFCDAVDWDCNYLFEDCIELGIDTRGQTTMYTSVVFQLQFRKFLFSLVVFERLARLIRWDRSPLAGFVWRSGVLICA